MNPRPAADPDLVARVAKALESQEGVAAAYVFGSRARGTARSDSDIDVALLLDASPAKHERASLIRDLVGELGRELAADRVDLVLLNDAPPVLAFHALKAGVLALCRDEVALHRFKVATYGRHADREPTERLFRDVTRRRAREAGGG